MKKILSKILKKAIEELEEPFAKSEFSLEEIESKIEIPPSIEMGDFAFPCFVLASKLKSAPHDIALALRAKIGQPKKFSDIQTSGAYLNFFIDRKSLALNILKEIEKQKDNFGRNQIPPEKIMVEFPSPNTNKPLHLGHLRNMAIGESVSRILEFSNAKVIRVNLNNDRGIHICKSMLAYSKWGKNKKPSKKIKSDKLVGDFYVMFNNKLKKNKDLEIEVHEMLRKWEAGDKKTIALWKKMNKWAFDGFKKTYQNFGIKHDREYFESEIYTKGREIIIKGVEQNLFQKESDGAVSVDLEEQGLGKKYLLRADGTSVYVTQDIYLAQKKFKDFSLNKSIYITGNEQIYHFAVLFYLLEKLRIGNAENLFHLSYGMVNLPEGKMKSREGTVVDADDLIEKVQNLGKKELKTRQKISKRELEKRSLQIALAAIKYMLLKVDIKKDTVFNPKESISFEGDTGPYIQYTYARANSILKKAKQKNIPLKICELNPHETELIKKLSQFKETVSSSYRNLNPSLIASYSYQLAQLFNEFYHCCPVLGDKKEKFRLGLVNATQQVLKNTLYLLGIEAIREM